MEKRNFNIDLGNSYENHDWLVNNGFYKNYPNLLPVVAKTGWTLGDYYYIDPFWKTEYYIEEKQIDSKDSLFIETWSCRADRNPGWIYKNTPDLYVYRNNTSVYKLDPVKLKTWWFNIYPNPSINYNVVNEEKLKTYIADNYNFYFNICKTDNRSEGYYIQLHYFLENKIIIK